MEEIKANIIKREDDRDKKSEYYPVFKKKEINY